MSRKTKVTEILGGELGGGRKKGRHLEGKGKRVFRWWHRKKELKNHTTAPMELRYTSTLRRKPRTRVHLGIGISLWVTENQLMVLCRGITWSDWHCKVRIMVAVDRLKKRSKVISLEAVTAMWEMIRVYEKFGSDNRNQGIIYKTKLTVLGDNEH